MGVRSQLQRIDEFRQRGAAFLSPAFAAARVAPLIGETDAGCAVDIVRVKTGRVTVRYRFSSGAVVYAKAYRGKLGRKLYATLCVLWQTGFNDSSWFRVPEPLAFLEQDNLVLMREAAGTPLGRQLAACPPEIATVRVRAAARWLLALHSAELADPDREEIYKRARILKESDVLAEGASAHPEHAPALLEFLDYLKQLAQSSAADPPLAPTHGQFTPSTVFVDSNLVTAIDLDGVALSDPAQDVATFISKVKYQELFKANGEPARAARLASEFIDEYARSAGRNLANLPYYRALYCLKEFAKSLALPETDRPARDRAEGLCRRELQRCLGEGAPLRSLARARNGESSSDGAIAVWSALSAAPGNSAGDEARGPKVTLVEARCTTRLTFRLTAHSGGCRYAKWYPDYRGRRAAKVAAELWGSGFGSDSPYRVPAIVAFMPDRNVLMMQAAEGVPLSAVLEKGSVAEAVLVSRRAARWLTALHRSPTRVGPPEREWSSLRLFRLPARLVEFCAAFPDHLAPLLDIVNQLRHCVGRPPAATSLVQTHGSYRPKHVFVADGVTTAIDLDRSLPADPAKDVAEFVTDLRCAAYDGRYDAGLVERAREAFLEEYFWQASKLESRVACYSACYLALRLLKGLHRGDAVDPRWSERFEFYRAAIAVLASRQ